MQEQSSCLSPDDLRDAALRLRASVAQRINQKQVGVPTYFDAYLAQLIDHFSSTEAIHGWKSEPGATSGTESGDLAMGLQWLRQFIAARDQERFVSYGARRALDGLHVCEIGALELEMSQGVGGCLEWRGKPLFKTVFDFALLPMLVQEMKPATILEIGSGTGASGRWMADICALAGLPTRVFSVDLRPVVDGDQTAVTFCRGDCNEPASLFPVESLHAAARPWLLIEDAHTNSDGVLRHFDGYLRAGDYLIVEDSRDKHDALGAFITDRYRVDTRYTDFFGRNATSAEDAIFAVMA